MSGSRRYQLRLSPPLDSELQTFARQHGLSLCSAIRLLIGRGLHAEAERPPASTSLPDAPAALAALLAAEHAVLMVASVLPEGERRMRELEQRASLAAEERLALFLSDQEGGEGDR